MSEKIESLSKVTNKYLELTKGPKSQSGRGGMYSKLLAARRASLTGIKTHILPGERKAVLTDLLEGKKVGTEIG